MPIPKGSKTNFDTLSTAIKNGDCAIMECTDKVTGETVDALCAVNFDGKEYAFVPLAFMLRSNPYDRFDPPDPNAN